MAQLDYTCPRCDYERYRLLVEGTAECLRCLTVFDVTEEEFIWDGHKPKVRKLRRHEYDDDR